MNYNNFASLDSQHDVKQNDMKKHNYNCFQEGYIIICNKCHRISFSPGSSCAANTMKIAAMTLSGMNVEFLQLLEDPD
jgi:hypothetical protein